MRISCIPVSYFAAIRSGEMPITDWMDFAAELGLDGVECAPPLIAPLGPVSAAEYRRLAEGRGLAISNYTAYSDFTNPDPEVRRDDLQAAIENVRTAKELGAPTVRALTGQQWPEADRVQALEWIVDGICRVAEEAERAGVRVNVENHTKASTWKHFDFAMQADVFLTIMERLEGAPVGVQFDIANPLVAGDDPLALFEKLRYRIGYVHANDVPRAGVFEFVRVGTGMAPVREVLSALGQQGYTGWVGIEEASRSGADGFRQAVRFTREAAAAVK
jgi:sugar phosphate isomerase/epimerase